MRLASLLATARCQRVVANTRNFGRDGIDQCERKVEAATAELRAYLENLPCPPSPS